MLDSDWFWQAILPAFFAVGMIVMLLVVFRPRVRFGPKVYLPRSLTPEQERNITMSLYLGHRDWAISRYAELTGADEHEAAYAIDHWNDR